MCDFIPRIVLQTFSHKSHFILVFTKSDFSKLWMVSLCAQYFLCLANFLLQLGQMYSLWYWILCAFRISLFFKRDWYVLQGNLFSCLPYIFVPTPWALNLCSLKIWLLSNGRRHLSHTNVLSSILLVAIPLFFYSFFPCFLAKLQTSVSDCLSLPSSNPELNNSPSSKFIVVHKKLCTPLFSIFALLSVLPLTLSKFFTVICV